MKTANDECTGILFRWALFQEKIENRFMIILDDAETECIEMLISENYNPIPIRNAWQAVRMQLIAMAAKLHETCRNIRELINEDDYNKYNFCGQASELELRLFRVLEKRSVIFNGKISQMIYEHALHKLEGTFRCQQCGADIPLRKDVFHSHYISCSYCSRVNTYEPGTEVQNVTWCLHQMAEYGALRELEKVWEMETQLRAIRPPVSQNKLDEYTEVYADFLKKYLGEKTRISPSCEKFAEKELQNKMDQFRRNLSQYV